ncbi:WXG100 family type VII secretion target [Streptomyces chitinivorans]|uniref:WXG100 family type VII secretion target n=1 Tax=Streptomyces chitinivorans TaxID=1257027 RepID=A0ABW7HWN4_9ACTN|nr:WXG100 family type VII secretion target [Streptomyces chitinivorans]MDH2407446.1 WXG100 family type VII secretion target [Streptomyces chitinivorans]
MSDEDDISVDFTGLRDLSRSLEEILDDLTRKLDGLYERTEKTVLSWEGEARDAFVDALDSWDRSLQDLEGAQRWLHDVVVTGHVNYDAAHKAVLRGWGGD